MVNESSYICSCGFRPDPKHKFCLKCGCPKIAEIVLPEKLEESIVAEKVEQKSKKTVTAKTKSADANPKAKTIAAKKTSAKIQTAAGSKKSKTVTVAVKTKEKTPKGNE